MITSRLIDEKARLVDFLNRLQDSTHVYFHRMMPSGRALRDEIPAIERIMDFTKYITASTSAFLGVAFHHTINNSKCKAFVKRLFINNDGEVYGCGWINEDSKAIGNVYSQGFSELLNNSMAGEYSNKARCIIKGYK